MTALGGVLAALKEFDETCSFLSLRAMDCGRFGEAQAWKETGDSARQSSAAVVELIERDRTRSMEVEHLRKQHHRMISILAAIQMRCAPDDITVGDSVRRFVPPDPEFYWRELSAKVKGVSDEIRAIHQADDEAEFDRAALSRVGGAA